MMEKKRTRAWRRHQARRVFKARLKYAAVCRTYENVTWKDLLEGNKCHIYKTTGTPCSCWICKGESYDRAKERHESSREIKDAYEESTEC